MTTICPLCGKDKAYKSLFCAECTDKLNSEYELNVRTADKSLANSVENREQDEHLERDEHLEKLEQDTEWADEDIEEDIGEDIEEEPEEQEKPSDLEEPSVQKEPSEQKEPEKTVEPVEPEEPLAAPLFDKKAWKKQRPDKRTDSEKTYYEIEKEKKGNKVRFSIITLLLLVLAIVAGLYIYNKEVRSGNLERSKWEVAQRENTVDSYLTYMDEHPQGGYVDEAHTRILSLKNEEAEMWQNLMSSENTIEFADFIERYPQSPYERKVKSRYDSLMWQTAVKENSKESYSDYIDRATRQEISGDYIGNAEKRFEMLNQTTLIEEIDLMLIRESVNGFFVGLSNLSHDELSQYLAPMVVRFNNMVNMPNQQMIGQLLLLAAKDDAKLLRYEPSITKLQYEQVAGGAVKINVPLQKIFEDENGGATQIKGYIVHLKMDPNFKIYSYYETKPFAEAP